MSETETTADLETTIRENAANPSKVSGDQGSVETRAVSETIEADRYLASRKAVKNKGYGIRKSIVSFGGA
ncbi:MAG: hypothetical protein PSV22_01875 [Pseudolabrys sp.]|nr:hypothetical protein [Pseudolabrys sp.]